MTEKIRLTINGTGVRVNKGATVLEAAQAAGIYIPTLCADPDLEPYGSCRLCVVEIEGMRGLPTACTTPATDGMVVHTETPAANEVRRTAVELLLADHPVDCLTCPKNQQCELQKVAAYLGITERRFPHTDRTFEVDASNPFFNLYRNYCILCARCVRTCQEVTGVGAIDLAYRGYQTRVAAFGDKPMMESICKSCGECVERCPVGALIPKVNLQPAYEVKTTCPYCGVGCQMYLGVRDGQVMRVRGDRENEVNRGRLCVKGRYGATEFIHHPERLNNPLVRRNGEFSEATWDEALDEVASRLGKYQPEEVAIVSSAKCTNEENYLLQKLGRAVIGTHNIDHCARL
jgi:predicted molibdopterin-dependent oxidoreductase YjgC